MTSRTLLGRAFLAVALAAAAAAPASAQLSWNVTYQDTPNNGFANSAGGVGLQRQATIQASLDYLA
ncbi:MAG: hypothetical protein ACRC7O_09430, partial [Fimbriiglobus sp.]